MIRIFFSLFLLILLFSFVVLRCTPDAYKNLERINYPPLEEIDEVPEREILETYPSIDPYSASLLNEAVYYNYDYSYFDKYYLPDNLMSTDTRLKGIIEDKSFYSITGVLKYLQLNKRFKEEKYVMNLIAKNKEFNRYAGGYFYYIEESYLNFVEPLVENNQIWKAKKMVGLAYERLILYDPPPLDNLTISNRMIIDKVLLYNMLFNDPRLLFKDKEFLLKYIYLIESEFRHSFGYEEYLKKILKQNFPVDITNYFQALDLFYKKNYQEAFNLFENISNHSPNIPLVNLAYLMQVRSVFWSQKREMPPFMTREQAVLEFDRINSRIIKNSLKSDIRYYKDSLLVEPFRMAQDEND